MRTIRNLFAVVLMGLAAAAFQVDACAQSRNSNVNRSSSSTVQKKQAATKPATRSSAVKPSVQTGRVASATRQNPVRSSSSNTSVTRPSSGVSSASKPSSGASSISRPSSGSSSSVSRPAATRPASRPSATKPAENRPSVQAKPSSGTPDNRPQSGSVTTRKPSTTVNRPGYRPGDKKPSESPVTSAKPEARPGQRPGAGSAFKPNNAKPPVKVYPNHKPDAPRVHPVHRDFIAYDRPSRFWTPDYHYFGHRVRILPAKARLVKRFGISYYRYNDIWYRPLGGYYVICRPPFGTVLAADLISDIAWTAVKFSYYNTVLNSYRQINENNRYIAEQNEIIAKNNATIAAQNAAIAMNQKQAASAFTLADELGLIQSYASADGEYFYQDGVFYAQDASGEYKVIVPPAGALVDSLPDDYDMVTLNGDEYYKVDETVYKITLNDGKPYFEVLGQLYS